VGWGVAFFDLDDGWPDLIIVNGHVYPQAGTKDIGTKYREPKVLYLNQRDGAFRDTSKLAGSAIQIPQVSRGLAVGHCSMMAAWILWSRTWQANP
jgi:hypothetical protein